MINKDSYTVLVVDDSCEDRATYHRYFSQDDRYTYKILEAASVHAALAHCERTQPDLILLDYQLPGDDGLDFLQEWKTRYGSIPAPVVMLSGQVTTQVAAEATKQGVQDYWEKESLTQALFARSVHSVLERLELISQLEQKCRQQQLLSAIASRIRQSLNLDTVLQTAAQEVLELLQADRVVLYRLWDDGTGTVITEAVLPDYPRILEQSFAEEVFPKEYHQFYCNGGVRLISDIDSEAVSTCLAAFVKSFGVRAKLVVPILQRENETDFLWGLLIVHQCNAPRHWQDWEVELLQQLATHLMIGIQQSELYERAQAELYERVQAELRERQRVAAEFRALVENATDVIYRIDADLRCLYFNPAIESLLQQPAASLIGKTPRDLGASEEITTLWQDLLDRITLTRVEETIEHPFPDPASPVWFQIRVVPELDETGAVSSFLCIARDISDRKRSEATLYLQAQVLNQIHDAVISTDLDGTIQTWNLGAEHLYGYKAEEAIGQTISMLYLPEDLPNMGKTIFRPLLTSGSHEIELRNQTKSGNQIDVSLRLSIVRDEAGNTIRLIGCSHDITERKRIEAERQQAEKTLQDNQILLQLVMDSLPLGIFWKDRQSRFLGCNRQMVLDSGFSSAKEIIGRTDLDMPWKDEAPFYRVDDFLVIKSGQPKLGIEEPITKSGNIKRWLRTSKLPLRTNDGEIIGVLGSYEDITERKQIEQALRESERRYETLAAAAPVGIYRTDAEGNCLYVNDRWCQIAGLTPEEAAGKGWTQGLHPDDRDMIAAVWDYCAETGEMFCLEFRFQRPDGVITWVFGQAVQKKDATGMVTGYVGTITDISDRKAMEQELQSLNYELEARVEQRTAELQESQQFIQNVTDSIPNALYIYDLDEDRYIYANCEVEQALGYSPDQFCNTGSALFLNLMHPEDLEKFTRYLLDLRELHDQDTQSLEYRLISPEGEWRWYLSHDTLFRRAGDGHVQQIIGMVQDITTRKCIEEQLRYSEAQLKTAQRIARLGSWEFDVQTGAITWSEEVFEIFGRPIQQSPPTYKELIAMIHPEDRQHHQSLVQQVLNEGQPYLSELRLYHPDGSLRYIQVRGEASSQADGQVTKLFGTILDITERKQSEEQLRHLSERLTLALQSGGFGSWEYDFERSQQIWDDRMYELYGIDPATFTGTMDEWLSYLHPDDLEPIRSIFQQVVLHGSEYSAEFRVIHPNGSIRYLKAFGLLQRNQKYEPVRIIGINYDVTDLKLTEEQLREVNDRLTLTNAELYRATRLKDEFLANMSHELRTPLNAILGMTESLQDELLGTLSDRQKNAIKTIERSGQHLLELINDILDLAKVESGQLELQLAPVEIDHLCTSSLNFVRQQAISKNIQLTAEIPFGLPAVIVDELRIRQVLINLLSNAVKFTPNGGQVRLIAQQEQSQQQRFLCFQVMDTGIGIAEENIEKLFKPFTQIDSHLNRKHMGTGLGLSLVRRLVELHQGTVDVSSQFGQGSCFSVCLPYPGEPTADNLDFLQHKLTGKLETQSGQSLYGKEGLITNVLVEPNVNDVILLVEDNEASATTVSNYLEAKGYQLLWAKNGVEAIALATTQYPNLILMDIQMPEMDGLTAIAGIRQHPDLAQTPIIAVTALAMAGDREKCLATGANDYITKPIKLKQLISIIHRWLK